MASRRIPATRLTPLFICAMGLALGLPVLEGRAPKASVLRFNITPKVGSTVASDGLVDSPGETGWQYADFRVSSLPTPPPVCVGAEVTAGSFVFIALNRTIGAPLGSNNGPRCSSLEQGGTRRQWSVTITNEAVCNKLYHYDPKYVESEFDGTTFVSCRLNGADNARMRFANLYANKLPAKTPIAFLISSFQPNPSTHGGFEIKSEIDADVTGNATTREIDYNGTARLHEFVDRGTAVEAPFPLRMSAKFVKSTVAQ